jgi:prepilin-type N-terminal cleavage/methylation domain-containing protein
MTKPGFTLVETLVAIAILMVAIVGPFYMLQQAITSANAARDQLIASSLAQEGVEYVYFVRNNNFLASRSWLNGLTGCSAAAGCTIDAAASSITACSSSGCAPLSMVGTLYTHASGVPSKFTRSVRIQQVGTTQVKVTVTVTWSTSRAAYSIVVVEDLYNWL